MVKVDLQTIKALLEDAKGGLITIEDIDKATMDGDWLEIGEFSYSIIERDEEDEQSK